MPKGGWLRIGGGCRLFASAPTTGATLRAVGRWLRLRLRQMGIKGSCWLRLRLRQMGIKGSRWLRLRLQRASPYPLQLRGGVVLAPGFASPTPSLRWVGVALAPCSLPPCLRPKPPLNSPCLALPSPQTARASLLPLPFPPFAKSPPPAPYSQPPPALTG